MSSKHITVFGILLSINGVLGALLGLILLVVGPTTIFGLDLGSSFEGLDEILGGNAGVAIVIAASAIFMMFMSAIEITVGIGVTRRHPVARYVAILLCVLMLPGIPEGTLLGIYGLIVLLNGTLAKEFSRGNEDTGEA